MQADAAEPDPWVDPMTPSSEMVRQLLLDAGLDRVADQIMSAVQPAVQLRAEPTGEGVLPLGKSKIGGRPDAPPGFQWPVWRETPLSFVAQIDLGEFAGHSSANRLPSTGRLLFFYDAAQRSWGFDPQDRGSFAVVYSNTSDATTVRHDWPEGVPSQARFGACAVEFQEVPTLPPWGSILLDRLQLSEKERDRYFDVLNSLRGDDANTAWHQVLGHSSPIQGDMQLECQLVAHGIYLGRAEGFRDPRRAALEPGATSWQLLLQLDSEEGAGMMWGDVGCLYYWIRDEDLDRRRFDQSWMILQCG